MLLDNKVVDFYFAIDEISGTLMSDWNRRPNREIARLVLQTAAIEVVIRDTKGDSNRRFIATSCSLAIALRYASLYGSQQNVY